MTGCWIQTYTGKRFDPLDPDPDSVDPVDIAHALSLVCRFNGHCRTFYSVGQHALIVSDLVPQVGGLPLWGLLHDAAEAYIADLGSPVKRVMPEYKRIENNLLRCIVQKYGLAWPMPDEVHHADLIALATEQRDLMMPPPEPWGLDVEPARVTVVGLPSDLIERVFYRRFYELSMLGQER